MFTQFDVFVSIVMMISIISSMLHGFVQDLLKLLGWIGAAFLTLYFFPMATSLGHEVFKDSVVVNSFSVILLFVIVLVGISIFNKMLLDNMREMRLGVIDRSLGMLFGFAKGLVIVSVIHFFILVVADEEPKWLIHGKTYGLTNMGAQMIMNMVSDEEDSDEKVDKHKRSVKEEDPERRGSDSDSGE